VAYSDFCLGKMAGMLGALRDQRSKGAIMLGYFAYFVSAFCTLQSLLKFIDDE